MAKKIIFRIDKEGNITSDVQGINGPACMDYLDLIQDITEGEIIETEKTKEYYQHGDIDQHEELGSNIK